MRLRSDDQLVALFRMGYDEAFRAIHDRYRQRLFAYTRQMLSGSRSDAEDVLQDVFLRAYGALRQDDRPVTLRAWLYRVAHNRCIDHLRRPVPPAAEVYELTRTPQHDPPGETERREDLRDLVKDVGRLPEQQRSALLMRELDGLSYAELADALRTTVPAVKSLLVRARIGLVEAGEARGTACAEIRADIEHAVDRGVRSSARSRRHLRDCSGCRDYRRALRGAHGRFAALGGGPLATLAKILGIGGASSGAAAGASAGGSAALVGGATAATATKVAAIVCCAAVVGGGAVEVRHHVTTVKPAHRATVHRKAAPARAASAAPAAAPVHVTPLVAPRARTTDPVREQPAAAPKHKRAADHGGTKAPATSADDPAAATAPVTAAPSAPAAPEEAQTGGAMAPDEDAIPDTSPTGGDGAPDVAGADDPGAATAPATGTQPQATVPQQLTPAQPGGAAPGGTPTTG
ncbi:MAG TPA: sigma-70 family RNA polymerase sigma factor [Solirubrobacteraceae bacterium]